MITQQRYSKDPGIIPEGIAVTWGREMIAEKGGLLAFIRYFEKEMADEESIWMQKCKNKPTYEDIQFVYVIVCNQVKYRLYYGGTPLEKQKHTTAMDIRGAHVQLSAGHVYYLQARLRKRQ